jgi:hypothetical protein
MCSAGAQISTTSAPAELSMTRCRIFGGCSTQSPACITIGSPWPS